MTITLFIVSLIGLSVLIVSKVFEIKVRKIDFLVNAFHKGDARIHAGIDHAYFYYNRYKKIASLFVFDFLPSYLYEMLVKMKDYTSKKYYSKTDDFRGKRVLRNTGSVSF